MSDHGTPHHIGDDFTATLIAFTATLIALPPGIAVSCRCA